jgi:hypothetical protein
VFPVRFDGVSPATVARCRDGCGLAHTSPAVQAPETIALDLGAMTALDVRYDAPEPMSVHRHASDARLLATALIQVLSRDEPPPARWTSRPFCEAVADAPEIEDLDALGAGLREPTFRGAAAALAADPNAVALGVRRLELARGAPLPPWPDIVRHGVSPRLTPADGAWWFG